MKLWHDDIRPAPEGWVWARTNEAAQHLLATGSVEEISMDHDLGLHTFTEEQIAEDIELIFKAGTGSETGLDLVDWMIKNDCVPAKITIHSWNPAGAKNMAVMLNHFGYNVVIDPFKVPKTITLDIPSQSTKVSKI